MQSPEGKCPPARGARVEGGGGELKGERTSTGSLLRTHPVWREYPIARPQCCARFSPRSSGRRCAHLVGGRQEVAEVAEAEAQPRKNRG
jgi:hypothetical protein